MVALVDVVARLLQRDVLAPPEDVERADRRVAVLAAGQEGADGLEERCTRHDLGLVPAGSQEGVVDLAGRADHDEVERVGGALGLLVGGAAGLLGDGADERARVDVDDLVGRIEVRPVDFVVVDLQPGHGHEEGEGDELAGRHDVDVERLAALVEVREHEARTRLARQQPDVEGRVEEVAAALEIELVVVVFEVEVRDLDGREVGRGRAPPAGTSRPRPGRSRSRSRRAGPCACTGSRRRAASSRVRWAPPPRRARRRAPGLRARSRKATWSTGRGSKEPAQPSAKLHASDSSEAGSMRESDHHREPSTGGSSHWMFTRLDLRDRVAREPEDDAVAVPEIRGALGSPVRRAPPRSAR